MRNDRAEIEAVLHAGKEILSKRPELVTMALDSVIDELDDGTFVTVGVLQHRLLLVT